MANRKQHIVELAAEVVYRQGFKGTSVDNVLEIAGVGKGNFYHYFRSKDDLGVAIIGEIEKWVNGAAGDELFSPTKSPRQRLRDYLTFIARQRHSDNHGDPLGNLLAELGDVEPFAKPLRRALESLIDRFEALVSEYAMERGSTIHARSMARAFAADIQGLCTIYKVEQDRLAFDEGLAQIEELLESQAFQRVHVPERETTYSSSE